MKKYLALLLFVFITTLSFGQSNYQDVVYLKNGSIIRGVIIEQVPNKSIKIETADRSVFVYQMDEIEKFTKEPFKGSSSNAINNSGLLSKNKMILDLGYQIGTGDYGMDRVKLDIIKSYHINPNFSLGFGAGLRYYIDAEAALIPVFADLRINASNDKSSPYFSLGVGYSFDEKNDFEGVGLLLNPTIGVSFKVSDKSILNVGLGYEMQKMDFYDYWNGGISKETSGAISINIGMAF
jgi:hypothetical protein